MERGNTLNWFMREGFAHLNDGKRKWEIANSSTGKDEYWLCVNQNNAEVNSLLCAIEVIECAGIGSTEKDIKTGETIPACWHWRVKIPNVE